MGRAVAINTAGETFGLLEKKINKYMLSQLAVSLRLVNDFTVLQLCLLLTVKRFFSVTVLGAGVFYFL